LYFVVGIIAALAALWFWFDLFGPLAVLDSPDRVTLYSIRGDAFRFTRKKHPGEEFRGFPVLGRNEINDERKCRALAAALKQGINSAPGDVYACFWPRHALRVTSGGRTIDFLICFECEWVYVYDESSEKRLHVSKGSQPIFDQSLLDAGLKLAKDVPPDRE
jgi:hypothetical protein